MTTPRILELVEQENSPSARVQVRSRGELMAPGTCALCGSGNCDAGYVDFGIWVDYLGYVYLCMTCMIEASLVVKCAPPDMVNEFKEAYNELNESLNVALSQLEDKDDRLTAYARILGDSTPVGLSSDADDPVSEESKARHDSADEDVSGRAAGESEPPQSVTRRRRANTSQPSSSNSPELKL